MCLCISEWTLPFCSVVCPMLLGGGKMGCFSNCEYVLIDCCQAHWTQPYIVGVVMGVVTLRVCVCVCCYGTLQRDSGLWSGMANSYTGATN